MKYQWRPKYHGSMLCDVDDDYTTAELYCVLDDGIGITLAELSDIDCYTTADLKKFREAGGQLSLVDANSGLYITRTGDKVSFTAYIGGSGCGSLTVSDLPYDITLDDCLDAIHSFLKSSE